MEEQPSHTTPTDEVVEETTQEKTDEPETTVTEQVKKPFKIKRKFRNMTKSFGHLDNLKKPKWKVRHPPHIFLINCKLSVESQKGIIIIQQCFAENQKGVIAVQSL